MHGGFGYLGYILSLSWFIIYIGPALIAALLGYAGYRWYKWKKNKDKK